MMDSKNNLLGTKTYLVGAMDRVKDGEGLGEIIFQAL